MENAQDLNSCRFSSLRWSHPPCRSTLLRRRGPLQQHDDGLLFSFTIRYGSENGNGLPRQARDDNDNDKITSRSRRTRASAVALRTDKRDFVLRKICLEEIVLGDLVIVAATVVLLHVFCVCGCRQRSNSTTVILSRQAQDQTRDEKLHGN